MPLVVSILLLSTAALAYEVLLMRLFSIVQWHHFAAMVISLALLGHGASGTLIALARRPLLRHFRSAYLGGILIFGIGSLGAFAVAQRLPFNPLEVVWDWRQLGALAGLYLVLAVPFFGAAGAIGLALVRFDRRIHLLYRADLLGAGLGAAGIVALLLLRHPARCLEWIAGLALLAAGAAAWDRRLGRHRGVGTALLLGGLLLPALWPDAWTALRISQFKPLPQALEAPGARVLTERSSPLGLLTVVESPRIPFRHAPGLSLGYGGSLPEQLGVFTDGDALSTITRFSGDRWELRYRDFLTSALPYHLLRDPRVLVLDAGGGGDLLTALFHRVDSIDAVEPDRRMVELLTGRFADFAGRIHERPGVSLHVAGPRGFVARARQGWDLIQVSPSGGGASGGAYGLSESHLFTVEAVRELYAALEDDGLLAFTQGFSTPPQESLKLFATAVAALEQAAVERPGDRLAMIRGWNTFTLLVKRGDLTDREIEIVRRFCRERSFDPAYYPGMPSGKANRFNVLAEPYLYDGAVALLAAGRDDYLARYKFFLEPATDDRPFFTRFFRWRTLPELLRLRGGGGTPLIQWGYLILVATLAQAVVAALLLVLAPVAVLRAGALRRRGTGRVGLYFVALGLAFLFVEIVLIQKLTLFLGHPIYAVAVVLGTFLIFAGLGSGASERLVDRLGRGAPARGVLPAWTLPALTAAVLAAAWAVLLPALGPLARLPDPARFGLAVLLIAPLAFTMGMPFPLGLARVAARHADWAPWAWAVNGCASVVSPLLATLLAVHAGFTAVLLGAAGLYALAALTGRALDDR